MKAHIRKIARGLAGAPVIGRLVRIGVALIRLPEFRDSIEQRVHQQSVRIAAASAHEVDALFQGEQLPGLLQAVADVNHRQILETNSQQNLARSVPVSLRKLTRDVVDLRSGAHDAAATIAGLRTGLDALEQRLQARFDEHAAVLADTARAEGVTAAQLTQLTDSVSYLLGRVEFVRREVMFEMRYGARSPMDADGAMAVQSEILAVDKVAQARQSGLRLNIGCGHVPLDGYINVDRRALPGVDVVAEADRLPFEANELAEICSKHLLEHFPLEQLRRELLPYWVSLLREDGVFRAVVPDGAGMARAFVNQEYTFENFREVTFGGQDYDGDFHFNMFSVDSLSQLLREAGLNTVEVVAENRENGGCKEFELVARR